MPKYEAVKPNSKNTVDKPRTKNTAGKIARLRPSCWADNSVTEIPLIYPRYGGTIGRTHGLKNDRTPANKATAIAGNKDASIRSTAIMCLI